MFTAFDNSGINEKIFQENNITWLGQSHSIQVLQKGKNKNKVIETSSKWKTRLV